METDSLVSQPLVVGQMNCSFYYLRFNPARLVGCGGFNSVHLGIKDSLNLLRQIRDLLELEFNTNSENRSSGTGTKDLTPPWLQILNLNW